MPGRRSGGNDDLAARGHSAGQSCGTPDVKHPAQAIEIASGFIQPERNPSIWACTHRRVSGAPASLVRDVSFRGPRKVDGLTEILKALTALYVAVGFWGTL